MARSFLETACQPNPGRSRPHSLGPMRARSLPLISLPTSGRYYHLARCYRAAAVATGGAVDRHSCCCCPSFPPALGREKGVQSPLLTPEVHPTPPSTSIPPPLTLHLHHHTSRGPQGFSSREVFLPGGQPECTVT